MLQVYVSLPFNTSSHTYYERDSIYARNIKLCINSTSKIFNFQTKNFGSNSAYTKLKKKNSLVFFFSFFLVINSLMFLMVDNVQKKIKKTQCGYPN